MWNAWLSSRWLVKMYWYILGCLNGVSHFWSKMYWYILGGVNGAPTNVFYF